MTEWPKGHRRRWPLSHLRRDRESHGTVKCLQGLGAARAEAVKGKFNAVN